MHLKVTVCIMTVSPVVNSEREAVKSVVLSSSLFSDFEMVGVSGITVMDVLSYSSPMPYYKNSTINKEIVISILFSTSFTYNY